MGLSKRAKRGIGILSHLQWRTKNWRYHVPAPTMISIDPNALPTSVLQAGVEAISKMRENANALQKLSDEEKDSGQNGPEARPADGVPVQPDNGEKGTQSSDDSASGGAK